MRAFLLCGRKTSARRQSQQRRTAGEDEGDVGLFDEAQWHEPPASWPQPSADLFVALGPHDAAEDFIEAAPITSAWRARLYKWLSRLPVNEHDLQSWLYPPASHLLTSRQLLRLFAAAGISSPPRRALDIGAGDGCVTAALRPLCEEVVAAETSKGMGRRLRRQGYEVWCEDIAETAEKRAADGGFELVTLFNVLDRCAKPRALLEGAHKLSAGWLLLSTPLPFMASFYGWRTGWSGRVVQGLGLEGAEWEQDALALLHEVLPSVGFEPRAVSRVPYLTGGDMLQGGCLELDDVVVIAEKVKRSL